MKKRKPNWSRIIPWSLALILVVCVILIFAKLLIWNKGKKIVITDEDIASIQIDTNDNIRILPASVFRPDTDDGIPTIAVFGNNTYYEGINNSTSIMDYVKKEIPDAVVYNFCIPDTRLTSYYADELSPEECPEDYFTFFWLTLCKKLGTMEKQETAINYLDPEKYDIARCRQVLTELETFDMDAVDLVLICYDGHEYLDGVLPRSLDGDDFEKTNSTTILGSITTSVFILNDGYPDTQFVYLSPVFCYATDSDGNKKDCDKYNTGNGTIAEYIYAARNASDYVGVSYMDLFNGVGINETNADKYLESDGITPNKEARRLIAERIAKLLSDRLIVKEK